jgi:hypothetical protein
MSADNEVGYMKPPKNHQFKKGQSGNHRGRPRRSISARSAFEKAMKRLVTLRIDDRLQRATALDAIFATLAALALKGNLKAIQDVVKLANEPRLLPSNPATLEADNGILSPITWTAEHESLRPFIEHLINDDKPMADEDARADRRDP